jgi:hypothetical protein
VDVDVGVGVDATEGRVAGIKYRVVVVVVGIVSSANNNNNNSNNNNKDKRKSSRSIDKRIKRQLPCDDIG